MNEYREAERESEKKEVLPIYDQAKKDITKEQEDKGMLLMDDDEKIKYISDIYEKRLDVISVDYKKKEIELKNEIQDLKKTLERYRPKDINIYFSKDWHKNIAFIVIELYTLVTKNPLDFDCDFCEKFEDDGYIEKLKNLWKTINLTEQKYEFIIWECDYADRFLNKQFDKNYDDRITKKGYNFWYARGLGINKFPAIDVTVKYKGGLGVERENPDNEEFFRIKGLGSIKRIDGDYQIEYGDFMNDLLLFFKDFDESVLEDLELHYKDETEHDMSIDAIRKRNRTEKLFIFRCKKILLQKMWNNY